MPTAIVCELSELVDQIQQIYPGEKCPDPTCDPCIPCTLPFKQLVLPPRSPNDLEPGQQPVYHVRCPALDEMKDEEDYNKRIANFYNNYNKDYHNDGTWYDLTIPPATGPMAKKPKSKCEYYKEPANKEKPSFQPCKITLIPPECNDPKLPWKAKIEKMKETKQCKKKKELYKPGPCTKPNCLHVKPASVCIYPHCCKAQCQDPDPSIKAIKWEQYKNTC